MCRGSRFGGGSQAAPARSGATARRAGAPSVDLTALGFAEAKVNTQGICVGWDCTEPPQTLEQRARRGGDQPQRRWSLRRRHVHGVRQDVRRQPVVGNSATAQMKDLVGPGDVNITNCGTVTIIKQTDPRGLDQVFDYVELAGTQMSFDRYDAGCLPAERQRKRR